MRDVMKKLWYYRLTLGWSIVVLTITLTMKTIK